MVRPLLIGGLLLLACGGSLATPAAAPASDSETNISAYLNVREFGARGDGRSSDTAAVQKALDKCAAGGGGTVMVPRGNYLVGSLVLGSRTTLEFDQGANLTGSSETNDYPVTRIRWEGEFALGHRALLSARNADHVSIVGPGSIFGPPLSVSRLRDPRGPVLIELTDCTNVLLADFSSQYQQLWSIHPFGCSNFVARNLTIRSLNPNGDGIDVDSCQQVLIEHCSIDTGDDAISLKSGRGLEAVRLGRPTEDVVIRDCSLISSLFAGLGIGSEMSGGIRNVRVQNCFISGGQNGIFIKSRDGRGGYIEDVSGEDLFIFNSPTFLAIDLIHKGIQATEPVSGDIAQWATVKRLTFKNIKVSHVDELVAGLRIPPERPLDGLSLAGITGVCGKGLALANMNNVKLSHIQVTGFEGPLLTTNHVRGEGLDKPEQ
jgi:polygalacturonase